MVKIFEMNEREREREREKERKREKSLKTQRGSGLIVEQYLSDYG